MLRQPKFVSKKEKYDYVEEVIKMLNMTDFAEAVVGVPGEGLNVEQRKLLTIGVELAAKPKLLLFLDEPTSGLDSQVSTLTMITVISRLLTPFTVFLVHHRLPPQTVFRRPSYPLHHPSALSNSLPRIRPPPLPRPRR
jgi:ATP-binding cassette subfamily G (WHITE) protein 2 (PDR)